MNKRRIWEMKTLFIPFFAIGLVLVIFPWLTFETHPIYTVLYIYVGVIVFFSLLRSKDSWIFELTKNQEKNFDKSITVIIWCICPSIFAFCGLLSIMIVLIWRKSIYVLSSGLSLIILFVLGIKLRIEGEFPHDQVIITPNHCSWVDDAIDPIMMNPIMIGSKKWKVLFAKEIKRIIFARFFLKRLGIPILRTELMSRLSVTREMKKFLDEGYNLLIKPEGRRLRVRENEEQELLSEFDDGAFFLSKLTGQKIQPVVILGTFAFKPRTGQWWYSPRTITIIYLDQVSINKDEEVKDFNERVRNSMLQILKDRNEACNKPIL